MKTFTNEREAVDYMSSYNIPRIRVGNYSDIVVLVDGPADNEFTIMPLKMALDSEFAFRVVTTNT
jgi:hypothetical protein